MKETKILVNLANLSARFSVDRWNKIPPLRYLCRLAYQKIGEYFADANKPTNSKWCMFNTYPLPYRDDVNFANWPEIAVRGNYTLITDPSGFAVRHDTSYCAWKLRELTGHWPRAKSQYYFHSHHWREFLSRLGYRTVVPFAELQDGHHYIGIDTTIRPRGRVVWFETATTSADGETVSCTVSTYRRREYVNIIYYLDNIDAANQMSQKIIWIQID